MLEHIWLTPPLAFARVGSSSTPSAAFMWAANDLRPDGTGSTSLQATETLTVAADGTVTSIVPREIVFRDREGIRPVCPFYELHGRWTDGGQTHEGPLTEELLKDWNVPLESVFWEVSVANLKPFHYTYQADDRIEATVRIAGTDTAMKPLRGSAPAGARKPIIAADRFLPMGAVQITKPTPGFPELRLRFHAPKGFIYGPTDLNDRLAAVDFDFVSPNGGQPNREWREFSVPDERLVVHPEAGWARYIPSRAELAPFGPNDYRNTPGGLLATLFERIEWLPDRPVLERSIGLVDDVCDGLVSCTLKVSGVELRAVARIVVGPPDFAPANRPPVSLADNLADREDRDTPRAAGWSKDELGELVADILERAFETQQLLHLDYQNYRSHRTNSGTLAERGSMSPFDADDVRAMLWPMPDQAVVVSGRASALTLTQTGTRRHRRQLALEYLEDRFREMPQLFEQWIRRPVDPNPFFDRRMPALMRGSDGRPLHLTRRQWEIFRAWIGALRVGTSAASPVPGGRA